MGKYILVINPGSTSTKIAVYHDEALVFEDKRAHSADELKPFPSVFSQRHFRKQVILDMVEAHQFPLSKLSAVSGRGGMLEPMKSGTYLVNERMVNYLKEARRGEHASNLGAILAKDIAESLNIPAFIVDPVAVDEMEDIARVSGMKGIERQSIFHALNHKSIGRQVAKDKGCRYEDLNLIIVHMGGGISVAAHKKGRVIDVNNALDGDGPMSPERSGTVPLGPLYTLCFSGKVTLNEIKQLNYGQGGLVAYLGTNDARVALRRIKDGDSYAKHVFDAMLYQVAKEVGAIATVLKGEIDAIVFTGGLAYESYVVNYLKERVGFLGEILVYPGENECLSLAQGALRVLRNEESAKVY